MATKRRTNNVRTTRKKRERGTHGGSQSMESIENYLKMANKNREQLLSSLQGLENLSPDKMKEKGFRIISLTIKITSLIMIVFYDLQYMMDKQMVSDETKKNEIDQLKQDMNMDSEIVSIFLVNNEPYDHLLSCLENVRNYSIRFKNIMK